MTDESAEIAWMVDVLSRHAGRLLASEHADQLCADLLGWTELIDLEDGGTALKQHKGLKREGERLAFRSPSRSVRLLCACGVRVPVPTDSEGRVDPDEVFACPGCGEAGVLGWWQRTLVGEHPQPMPLSDLPDWLAGVHALVVTPRQLRGWADDKTINPVERVPSQQGGRSRRLFDPVAVAVVAAERLVRRTA